jgi:hypothetical protein
MTAWSLVIGGVLLGLALPRMAAAQSDPLTARKLSCVPDMFWRCAPDGTCGGKEADFRDREQPLIIDTETKQAIVHLHDGDRELGTIVDDKIAAEVRIMTLREPGDANREPTLMINITRNGKLLVVSYDTRMRVEGRCSPAD